MKTPTILFVDDEPAVTSGLKRTLRREPWRILEAHSGPEALEVLTRESVDVIISDEAMPGMTGDNLAAALLHIRPDIPILITTGVIDSPILKKVEAIGVCNVLLKPVSAETLAGEIARLLVRRSPSEPGGST